jgi:hypothetical protein
VGRLLLTTAVAIAIFAGLIMAASVIGGRGEPSVVATALAAGDCSQPCWNGIRPGKTMWSQSEAILRAAAFVPSGQSTTCWRKSADSTVEACIIVYLSPHDRPIESITLFFPHFSTRLGDIVSVFGKPIASRLCVNPRAPAVAVRGYVFFKGDVRAVVINPARPNERRFSPDMIVSFVSYNPAGVFSSDVSVPRWAGFTGRADQWQC